jgi:NDP-sugar pyrophosphorylase family protein
LAAGVGSRLRPYTNHLPKPMLEIDGRPILDYNLQLLAEAGFDRVVLNLHYLPDVIRAYVGTGARWGIDVRFSEEAVLLGTAGALLPVEAEFRNETFAVVFGDNLAQIDLRAMLDAHRSYGAEATVALWKRDDVTQSGVAELDAGGRILRFIEKPAAAETNSTWVNAGYIIAEPSLLDEIPRDRPSDFGRDVFPAAIARGVPLLGFRMSGCLWWFDRVQDYVTAAADPGLRAYTAQLRRDRGVS